MFKLAWFPLVILCWMSSAAWAIADDQKSGKSTRTDDQRGAMTLLGTVKGEITRVTEGGSKIEIKYKEIVASSSTRSGAGQGSAGSARFRLPRTTLKEKNQELELRVYPETTIRMLNALGSHRDDGAKRADQEARDAAIQQDDDAVVRASKSKDKKAARSPRTKTLPGVAGLPGDLKKGQIVIVTVAREDLSGFHRLIAATVYVLGEK